MSKRLKSRELERIFIIILDGRYRKGITFSVPIVISYGIFYLISNFGMPMFAGGF